MTIFFFLLLLHIPIQKNSCILYYNFLLIPVKLVQNCHFQKYRKLVFKTNYRLMRSKVLPMFVRGNLFILYVLKCCSHGLN